MTGELDLDAQRQARMRADAARRAARLSESKAKIQKKIKIRRRWYGLTAVAVVVLLAAGITVLRLVEPGPFRPEFGPDGLVTNELTERHGDVDGVRRSDDWVATSGSLFARSGMGYSGRPDDIRPDVESKVSTDSAVLRVISRRRDFGDVRVRLKVRVAG